MHALTSFRPAGQYGPTVVATTRAPLAIAANDASSDVSAMTSGQSTPSSSASCSSFSGERPASPTVTPAGACSARYSATKRPTNPVTPKTTISMRWTLEHSGVRVRNSGVDGLRSLLGLPLNQLRVLEDVADDLKIIPMR